MLPHLPTAIDWQSDICMAGQEDPGTTSNLSCQNQYSQAQTNESTLAVDVLVVLFYNYKPAVCGVYWLDTLRRWVAIDWPTHVSDVLPKVVVQNQNQILSNRCHHKYTSRVQCDSCQQHPLNW